MTREIIVLVGAPASGKTTYIKEHYPHLTSVFHDDLEEFDIKTPEPISILAVCSLDDIPARIMPHVTTWLGFRGGIPELADLEVGLAVNIDTAITHKYKFVRQADYNLAIREIIVLVGAAASGKTTYVKKHYAHVPPTAIFHDDLEKFDIDTTDPMSICSL